MKHDIKVQPRWVIHFYLWLGLLAGTAVRSLALLERTCPEAVIWTWRFAMASYTVFFGYRYLITRRRRRVISNFQLLDRVEEVELDEDTKVALQYVLRSISRSKELFNYAFIASISLIAILLDIIITCMD